MKIYTSSEGLTDSHPSLVPTGASPEFTETSIPGALLARHETAPGRWGELEVIRGRIEFIDLSTGQPHSLIAGHRIAIPPQLPHRVALTAGQEVRVKLRFFREDQETPPPI